MGLTSSAGSTGDEVDAFAERVENNEETDVGHRLIRN
jgi:hypothetical protein